MPSFWWVFPVMVAVMYYYRRPRVWDECFFPSVDVQPPPPFEGALAQNQLLQNARKLFENELIAPESALIEGNTMYVSFEEGIAKIVNNKIAKIMKCPGGKPLGIRRLENDTLIFADALQGLVTLNHETDKFTTIIEPGFMHDGKPIMFVNDLDVINGSEVIFSDSTWIGSPSNFAPALVAATDSGRVFKYNLETAQIDLLMDHLHYSNGIQLFPDKESVLVSEMFTSTIWRHYLNGTNGTKLGESEVFAHNLPGLVDNVRMSKDEKSFYAAFCVTRVPEKFELRELLMKFPAVRWFLFNMVPHWIHPYLLPPFKNEDYGLFVQLNLEGEIIKSYHAPAGVFNHLSQVTDAGNKLYISSFINPYFAVVDK